MEQVGSPSHPGPRLLQRFATLAPAQVYALLLGVLLLGAAALRFTGWSDNMVAFGSTRQFRCAIQARAIYYDMTRSPTDPRRIVAEKQRANRGVLEPLVLEHIVAIGYRFAGREHLGYARIVGAVSWVLGSFFLARFAWLLWSPLAALAVVVYYCYLPYTIVACQSFQPDPLMMFFAVTAWYALLRAIDRPTWWRGLAAALIAGMAILIKPVCAFATAALLLVLHTTGTARPWRARLRSFVLLSVGVLLPAALYYLPEIIGGGRLLGQAEGSFQPQLWREARYWNGWRDLLVDIVGGRWVLAAAALGVLASKPGRPRAILIGLWLSYFVYGLLFSYHISTHNYYHLPVLPIVALCLGALIERARSLVSLLPRVPRRTVWALVPLALAFGGWKLSRAIAADALPRTRPPENQGENPYPLIGALVQHSSKVIFITTDSYGGPLEFDGELSGWYWDNSSDIRRTRRRGRPAFDADQEFDRLLGMNAEFFVVHPSDELPKQRRLAKRLSEYPLISNHPDFLVFDLRKKPGS
ncbi:MAG TPA: glycosyltransferase family 39 protein [Polyangiales bacterium]|nr:glycosyltransferase family 39 protein [Polyangiales bacterium]